MFAARSVRQRHMGRLIARALPQQVYMCGDWSPSCDSGVERGFSWRFSWE